MEKIDFEKKSVTFFKKSFRRNDFSFVTVYKGKIVSPKGIHNRCKIREIYQFSKNWELFFPVLDSLDFFFESSEIHGSLWEK